MIEYRSWYPIGDLQISMNNETLSIIPRGVGKLQLWRLNNGSSNEPFNRVQIEGPINSLFPVILNNYHRKSVYEQEQIPFIKALTEYKI